MQWKSLMSSTSLPTLEAKEQKKEKQLAIANLLISHAKIKVKATAKYKIPISKEVEIINKWKELDKVMIHKNVSKRNEICLKTFFLG